MNMLNKVMLIATVIMLASSSLKAQRTSNREVVKIQTNLDCDMCKKKIEDYMAFEKGVTAINADVPSKVVSIEFRTKRTDEQKLIDAIKKLGYEAEVVKEPEEKKE